MADCALTPDEITFIDATVDRVNAERADAATMAARYDAACVRIAEQHEENVKLRRRIEALEDQLADAQELAERYLPNGVAVLDTDSALLAAKDRNGC